MYVTVYVRMIQAASSVAVPVSKSSSQDSGTSTTVKPGVSETKLGPGEKRVRLQTSDGRQVRNMCYYFTKLKIY